MTEAELKDKALAFIIWATEHSGDGTGCLQGDLDWLSMEEKMLELGLLEKYINSAEHKFHNP